jgi:acyl carrier protein
MAITREQVKADTLELLRKLADDWEYSGAITEDTFLIADMGFESLGVVILSTTTQEHYDVILPFADFFAQVGAREVKDVTVREWIDFTHKHLSQVPSHG